MNFLIAVIAIGVPQAYLFLKGLVPRAAVIAFAIAIASAQQRSAHRHHRGAVALSGDRRDSWPGHILQGLFVSAIGVMALQIAIGYLSRRYPKTFRTVE